MNCRLMLFEQQKGQVSNVDYDFGYESGVRFRQNLVDFLITEHVTKQSLEKSIKIENQSTNKLIIIGIAYCEIPNMSKKLIKLFKDTFQNSIYFKQEMYLEAFQNANRYIEDIIDSVDLNDNFQMRQLSFYNFYTNIQFEDYKLSTNFIMLMDDKMYFYQNPKRSNNLWGIKLNGQEYTQIMVDMHLTRVQDSVYQLDHSLYTKLEEILLSNQFNEWDYLQIQNAKDLYPKLVNPLYQNTLHYLKLRINKD